MTKDTIKTRPKRIRLLGEFPVQIGDETQTVKNPILEIDSGPTPTKYTTDPAKGPYMELPFWVVSTLEKQGQVEAMPHHIAIVVDGCISYEAPDWPDGTMITIENKATGSRVVTEVGKGMPSLASIAIQETEFNREHLKDFGQHMYRLGSRPGIPLGWTMDDQVDDWLKLYPVSKEKEGAHA